MSKKTKAEKQVDTILEPYKNVDYDFINNSIKVTGNDKELGYISKKTIIHHLSLTKMVDYR